MLRVPLLDVAHVLDQLLAGDLLVVCAQVVLGRLSGVLHENAGIRVQSGHSAYHGVVERVHFLGRGVLLQQLGGDFALGGKHNAVLGENANGGTGVRDGLLRVLHLVEPSLRRKDGRSAVVSSRSHVVCG